MVTWFRSRNKVIRFIEESVDHLPENFDCRVYLVDGKTTWTGRVVTASTKGLTLYYSNTYINFPWEKIDYWAWVEKSDKILTSLDASPKTP